MMNELPSPSTSGTSVGSRRSIIPPSPIQPPTPSPFARRPSTSEPESPTTPTSAVGIPLSPTDLIDSPSIDYDTHYLQTKHAIQDIYGPFENYKKLTADKQFNNLPFLTPGKYVDPSGTINKWSKIIQANYDRQKDEVERIRQEQEESQAFEEQKEEFNQWNERRKSHQSDAAASPFAEPQPDVSQKVLDYFAEEDVNGLF